MSTIRYKGYQASVEYDAGQLYVRVLHVDDLLVAECQSAADVQGAFERLIDDYLETCKELGREPAKQFSGTFNVRVGADVHKRVAMAAVDASIPLNQWVVLALVEKLDCSNLSHRMDEIVERHRLDLEVIQMAASSSVTGAKIVRQEMVVDRQVQIVSSARRNWVN